MSNKGNVLITIIIIVLILIVTYFVLIVFGFKLSQNKTNTQINQPAEESKTFKDSQYSIRFNYPSNWYVVALDTTQNEISANKDKPLATALKNIWVSDIPHPTGAGQQYPKCEIHIGIHLNPQNLLIRDWYNQELAEVTTPPKNDLERKAYQDLKSQVSEIVLSGNTFLKTSSTGPYFLARGPYVYSIETPNSYSCSSSFSPILNSLKID